LAVHILFSVNFTETKYVGTLPYEISSHEISQRLQLWKCAW